MGDDLSLYIAEERLATLADAESFDVVGTEVVKQERAVPTGDADGCPIVEGADARPHRQGVVLNQNAVIHEARPYAATTAPVKQGCDLVGCPQDPLPRREGDSGGGIASADDVVSAAN